MPKTIVDALYDDTGDTGPALTFLSDGTPAGATNWSRSELLDQVERYATAFLERNVGRGDRIVLAVGPGLDFVAALYGILSIGAAAVPAFPPLRGKDADRFAAIVRDCDPALVVLDELLLPRTAALQDADHRFATLCPADVARLGTVSGVRVAAPAAETTALIQYTSGSTGQPKGVLITHENLVSNCLSIQRNVGTASGPGFSWLPPYHDMGLIGALIYPLYHGYPIVTMSPLHFVQAPLRWLAGMSHYRSVMTAAPNFALDLCVRAVAAEPVADLDLSALQSLCCGSEPVLEPVVRRFVDTFADYGLAPTAVLPCYGMAETTLFVAGKPAGTRYRVMPAPVGNGEASGPATTLAVSSGRVDPAHTVVVVDPASRRPVADGAAGEIWVSGPNVAAGYFGRPELSAEKFGATMDSEDDTGYLRTGDLGYLDGGELFVLGRIDDRIVICGRNIYPHDVEAALAAAHSWIAKVAVVGVPVDGEQRLGVLIEVRSEAAEPDLPVRAESLVRETVIRRVGINPHIIRIGGRRTVPTTTSGKLRRAEVRALLAAGRSPHESESSRGRQDVPVR
ncbi:fatty acyl-AMP ligase [Nocardia terpenica]|nr:fatty acyl-AMP ligase [Nocardia terpenica]NQE87476.1 fatty acyl-AMP ligase [Nocardia terpenica]